jgi:hypothetical protein
MPKHEAFDELFQRFQQMLKSPLTPEGAEEFILIYRDTVGHYLDCKKKERDKDYWDDGDFKKWALGSADKFAREVDQQTGSSALGAAKPAERHHVRKGADIAFDKIKADPNEHCNKEDKVPPCIDREPAEVFGPVCALYMSKRATRVSAGAT